jgi:biotin carboxylase
MKKLLLAGGSAGDIPMVLAAKGLGYHVTTSGNRAADLAHRHSDAFVSCDYSVAEEVLGVARQIGADAICASCNDFSAVSCAYVAKELGLPGHDDSEVAEVIHHKDRWRAFAQGLGIASPSAVGCANLDELEGALAELRAPFMVKPIDLTGGKGIQRVENIEDALRAAEVAFSISKAKRIVVEEFIAGTRHGFSCMLRGGKVVFHFTDDENYHLSQYLVSAAAPTISCPQSAVENLIRQSEMIAGALRLVDGIFHVQFILRPTGEPVIIEICRRAPGDLYAELVRHTTGVPYAEWIVRAASGMDLGCIRELPVKRYVTRHCLMAEKVGFFEGFDFDPDVESRIIDRMVWSLEGESVYDPRTHKFGIVFVDHGSLERMRVEGPLLQKLLQAKTREK